MATVTELETVLRRVLNEGTAHGQISWASTSKATLAAIQHVVNLINQQVIPPLDALAAAQNSGAWLTPNATEDPAANSPDTHTTDEDGVADQEQGQIDDAGAQRLGQAATDEERQAIEAALLVETDNGPYESDEEVSQQLGVSNDNR